MALSLEDALSQHLGSLRRDYAVDDPAQTESGEWAVLYGRKEKDGTWEPRSVLFDTETTGIEFARQMRKALIQLNKVNVTNTVS